MLAQLRDNEGIQDWNLAYAAGYSFAMVVRSALALSTDGARVTAFVGNSLHGLITLCAARHLLDGESNVAVYLSDHSLYLTEGSKLLLSSLQQRGADIETWSGDWSKVSERVENSHNVLSGLFAERNAQLVETFANNMNESAVPVHAVGFPVGVNPDTGLADGVPLFASSTLSLGIPLRGCIAGNDFLGRHYLCDLCFSREIYSRFGYTEAPLFSEQPVVKLKASAGNA